MTKRLRDVAYVCLWVVLGLIPARTAHAYTLKETDAGAPVRWAETSVRLWIAEDPGCGPDAEVLRAAAIEAAAAWREVPEAPRIVIGVGAPPEAIGYDPRVSDGNGIYVLCGNDWPYEEHLAITRSFIDESTGALLDTDILIDGSARLSSARITPSRAYDLVSILTHEMGHVLGLDESDEPEATMNTLAIRGDAGRRTLERDDTDAIAALYSAPFSHGTTCSASSEGRSRGARPWSLALFAAAGLLLARRFRNAR